MNYEAAFTAEAATAAENHLLQHYQQNIKQEDLCFALWRPSTGQNRTTALIDRIILPQAGETLLHGNASITPGYLGRAISLACQEKAGLAFLHSHPVPGFQKLSYPDFIAEQERIAPPATATGLPLLGLTIGNDGYWSARFWRRKQTQPNWCRKVRILGPQNYRLQFNNEMWKPITRRENLKRTYDSWGKETQENLARMNIGIIGLGSVGCIVAEAMTRIGVQHITLFDPDKVETHNLDRLLYGTEKTVGQLKVKVAQRQMQEHATAEHPWIEAIPLSIKNPKAYAKALDCDLLFSCVDRPVPRDILNHITNGHLIPVIDCGVKVQPLNRHKQFDTAQWRAHIITPYHQCLRCNGQYSTSMVSVELDGSLDNPSYIAALPAEENPNNQNVFPFSLGAASMAINLMLRYLLSPGWWPPVGQQDYQLHSGDLRIINEQCHEHCPFPERKAGGDAIKPAYILN